MDFGKCVDWIALEGWEIAGEEGGSLSGGVLGGSRWGSLLQGESPFLNVFFQIHGLDAIYA